MPVLRGTWRAIAAFLAVGAAALALAACGSSSHHKQRAASAQTTATTPHASTATTKSKKPRQAPPRGPAHHGPAAKVLKTPGSGPAANATPPGLRSTGSYGLYELCSGQCTGSVPAALERPLHLPHISPGASCPVSSPTGPVMPRGSPSIRVTGFIGSSWQGDEVTWAAAPSYKGPVLIRGRQLGGTGSVGFGEGHDPYDELQLLDAAQGEPRGPTRVWPTFTRVQGPGCYAYQVDGTSFSHVIVFRAG